MENFLIDVISSILQHIKSCIVSLKNQIHSIKLHVHKFSLGTGLGEAAGRPATGVIGYQGRPGGWQQGQAAVPQTRYRPNDPIQTQA